MKEIIEKQFEKKDSNAAKKIFSQLIQDNQLVGELYSINYDYANVLIHDTHRQQVGGIPSLSFLIASRINTNNDDINFKKEDSSIILLRVLDSASLPNNSEAERIRVETAQRVSGELDKHWDMEGMDPYTRNYLSYAGVKCRVIGTFFLVKSDPDNDNSNLSLRFGSDISNYYPNRGLKIYKPNDEALEMIVNYLDPTNTKEQRSNAKVRIGEIRYASTNRDFQGISNVPVFINPSDLLSQKSALFGMTRTGKSNTTKIIAQSVYNLRYPDNIDDTPLRIGQIIFDPNGEYANENAQDKDGQDNPNALKNVWEKKGIEIKKSDEVVTYGILEHPNDPDRILMRLNFYNNDYLQIGKEIINSALENQTAQYFENFRQVKFEKPIKKDYENDKEFYSEKIRFARRVLVYKALLNKAGLTPPTEKITISRTGFTLFSSKIIGAMKTVEDKKDKKKEGLIRSAADTIEKNSISWDALIPAFEGLFYFLKTDEYNKFNSEYIKKSSTGEGWADTDLEKLLEMFVYNKGANLIGVVKPQHSESIKLDYAQAIYDDLAKGKLVIVDQSSGEYNLNKFTADRVMNHIFLRNQSLFRKGEYPPDIMLYIEEAHNILPASEEKDTQDIWVRTAKEGAKYRLGMVYATQEVSSIQKNILKNTANWFISHLNNTDETKELCKFYDFADFDSSIRKAQDKGFLRVKTLSNLFVIPVQVKKFDMLDEG